MKLALLASGITFLICMAMLGTVTLFVSVAIMVAQYNIFIQFFWFSVVLSIYTGVFLLVLDIIKDIIDGIDGRTAQ